MEYKYVVHLSEDLAQHEEAVRKILAFDEHFNGSQDEYLSLCEEWVTFERFEHPGEAINYYQTEKIFPDLKIQDIDFTELKNKRNVPEEFRKNISGIYEIEFMLKVQEERKINKHVILIPYSGKLEDELIIQALHETNWLEKTVNKVLDVVGDRILKDKQAHLKLRIIESFKKLAHYYLKSLNGGEKIRLQNMASLKEYAVWADFKVQFETFIFPLHKMLIGFGDIRKMSPSEISKIVTSLISESRQEIEFNGKKWEKSSVCYNSLIEYLNNEGEYQLKKREITLRSIDVLMNLLKINREYGFDWPEQLSLAERNKLQKIGTHTKKHDWNIVFRDKLVGRRVMISLSELFEFTNVTAQNICQLISKGSTEYKITRNTKGGVTSLGQPLEERGLLTNTISTDLGLFRDKFNIVSADGHILPEELNFIRSYVTNGLVDSLRNFLDKIPSKFSYIGSYGIKKPEYFLDLTMFNEFIFSVQKSAPAQLKKILKDVDDFIVKDESYRDVKSILSVSNALFYR